MIKKEKSQVLGTTDHGLLVWSLTDDRPGNVSQVIGLSENLGVPYETKKIRYKNLNFLPNFIIGSSLLNLDKKNSDNLDTDNFPNLVISAGRRSAPIALNIKKRSNGKTKIAQIMSPNMSLKNFDYIIVPAHDKLAKLQAKNLNKIIVTTGALHKLNDDVIKTNKKIYLKFFSKLKAKKISVLIGGDTKKGKFTKDEAAKFGKILAKIANEQDASLLISTSRRTSKEAVAAIKIEIKNTSHYIYEFGVSKEDNPFMGLLSCADILIVSGDSISMCSEAASVGVPLYIYAPDGLIPNKHLNFHEVLYKENCARKLDVDNKNFKLEIFKLHKLNDAQMVASRLGFGD